MTVKPEHKRKKGFFGRSGFSVAAKYPARRSRLLLYLIGGSGAVLIGALFAMHASFSTGSLLASGPLSSNHAAFGTDCANCHASQTGVTDEKCTICHEKFGDNPGIHTFEAHYVYRSGDFGRVAPPANESACFSCHVEHQGREASITRVSDNQCRQCHAIESFNLDHPEFQIVREQLADPANLSFPHVRHVNELRRREKIVDIEKTCLYCHNTREDGIGFEAIEFDRHCDACHLSSSTATPFIPIASGGAPGVRTLGMIQDSQQAGSRWAFYTNPNEFQLRGDAVRKRPVYHEDPWILTNLRSLRNILYPANNLADLLRTSADVPVQDADVLYREAIQTLRDFAEELRNQPARNVQEELARSEELLQRVERALEDPLASRDETRFIVSASSINTTLTEDEIQTYENLVDQLTDSCRTCHVVENATIKRVQTDQKTLLRAEFNHRAHVIQRRCLDCHNIIPIRQFAAADSLAPASMDRASLYNLPNLATCQSCHAEDKASNTCVTCHAFHPDKRQSNLLLYVD